MKQQLGRKMPQNRQLHLLPCLNKLWALSLPRRGTGSNLCASATRTRALDIHASPMPVTRLCTCASLRDARPEASSRAGTFLGTASGTNTVRLCCCRSARSFAAAPLQHYEQRVEQLRLCAEQAGGIRMCVRQQRHNRPQRKQRRQARLVVRARDGPLQQAEQGAPQAGVEDHVDVTVRQRGCADEGDERALALRVPVAAAVAAKRGSIGVWLLRRRSRCERRAARRSGCSGTGFAGGSLPTSGRSA